MRCVTLIALFLLSAKVFCQFTDDFSDGDFTNNPAWIGDAGEFIVDEGQLRSNGPSEKSVLHLSTASTAINNAVWEFVIKLNFRPSASNRVKVYLVSDQSNLESSLNGYFLEIGQSGDDQIKIYRQDGTNNTLLFTGSTTIPSTGLPQVVIRLSIRVTRDDAGSWEVFINSSDDTFTSEGDPFTDNTYTSTEHFGVVAIHTSTRRSSFFFDDFTVTGTGFVDNDLPTIVSAEAISNTEVRITFSEDVEETTSETITNYAIDNGVSISTAAREDTNLNSVLLTTASLTNGQNYTLTIRNVEDLSGNAIAADSEVSLRYLFFEEAEELDIVINEFLADPTPAAALPGGDFIEIFNRSNKYISLKDWTIADNSGTSGPIENTFIEPGQYIILTGVSVASGYESFGEVIAVADFPNLNATGSDNIILSNSTGGTIAQLTYDSDLVEDATSAELVNPNDPCISATGYQLSKDGNGATPGSQNSVFDNTPDTQSPIISSFGFGSSLVLNFSEKMAAAALTSSSNYSSNSLTINQAEVEEEFPLSVEITFVEEVTLGVTYDFSVSGLSDCAGNQIADTTLTFGFGRTPSFNELLITEIFYDPDPSVGLPEREYIELFNNTSEIISTEEIALTDATSTTELPAFNLKPNAFYVLTSNDGASEFSTNPIGMTGFPSLNNSGELLTLSIGSDLIFSMEYNPKWHDDEKSEGGYSLEMVDLTNPCAESARNWRSSSNLSGGTPGSINSITESVPDSFGPVIETVTAISSDTIKIDFDEKIDPLSAANVQIETNPEISVLKIYFDLRTPGSLFIILSEELRTNQPYTILLSNLFDCVGNEVDSESIVFALPLSAEPGEIKLSEVLFNPRSGGVDFVEIYNDSEKYLSLKAWQLARLTEDEISDERTITNEELVIEPSGYLVFTTDPEILINDYPKGRFRQFFQVASLPGYNDDAGMVILLNELNEVIEQFSYSEDQHYDLLEDNQGVSLERISYTEPTNNTSNWRSAASTEGFATPGYANSQAITSTKRPAELVIEPKVFIPGNAGSGRDFTTINYQFRSSGQFANVSIYDQNGRLVRNLAQGVLLSTSGFLRWDGETNEGSMARMGYYIVLFEVYDAAGNTKIIKETVVVGRDF
ncbi:MAG: lamin tail domain-containing protein [Ekhidna sp.]|nr:lamin tail domain-containing protein [Ekhidna sp.]